MKVIIEGSPEEIAALVVATQERQDVGLRDPLEGLLITRPEAS